MTRVDFYLLSSTDSMSRLQTVCKLIDKANSRGQRVFVHSDDTELLKKLDESLWSFRPDRFIAHRLLIEPNPSAGVDESAAGSAAENTQATTLESVTLSSYEPVRTDAVLINLASEVPVFFSRFERTLEVIDGQDSIRLDGRARYRFYQERGYPLKYHNL